MTHLSLGTTLDRFGLLPLLVILAIFAAAPTASAQKAGDGVRSEVPDALRDHPLVAESMTRVFTLGDDGSASHRSSVRYRIQTSAGIGQLSQFSIAYLEGREEVEIVRARVHLTDGEVVEIPPSDIRDVAVSLQGETSLYLDLRQVIVIPPRLGVGAVFELEWDTRTIDSMMPGEVWMEHSFERVMPILDERVVVDLPAGLEADPWSAEGNAPTVEVVDGRRRYEWRHELVDPDSIPENPMLWVPPPPDVRFSSVDGFETLGAWYWGLQNPRAETTPALREVALERTAGMTDEEAVHALYDFVSTSIRYVSVGFDLGRYQPREAGEVLQSGFGDCKEKHTLLQALLAARGIRSFPVLVHSARPDGPRVPAPSEFDHLVSAVELGDSLVFLDATSGVYPYGYLDPGLRGSGALLVEEGSVRRVNLPERVPFDTGGELVLRGAVSPGGRLTASVEQTLRGDMEAMFRAGLSQAGSQWREESGTVFRYAWQLPGRPEGLEVVNLDDLTKPLRFEYELDVPDFLDPGSTERGAVLHLPAAIAVSTDLPRESSEPIELGGDSVWTASMEITFPPTSTVHPPLGLNLDTEFASYRSEYTVDGATLRVLREVRVLRSEMPAEESSRFRAFARAVESDRLQQVEIALAAGPGEAPGKGPDGARDGGGTPAELFDRAMAAFDAERDAEAAALLERVVEADPDHAQAWELLGKAYYYTNRYAEAEPALRRHLEMEPYPETTHYLLGRILEDRGRLGEAEEEFLRHLDLYPMDVSALHYLGRVVGRLERVEEAIPLHRRAVRLEPDTWLYRRWLADALLRGGRVDEGLAILEDHLAARTTRARLNWVASYLGNTGRRLERAREWSDLAIDSGTLRLPAADLGTGAATAEARLRTLSDYWRTRGWIEFQDGDLVSARAYLEAAWHVKVDDEPSLRLGRLHDALGDSTTAERYYVWALAHPELGGWEARRLEERLGGVDRARARVEELRAALAGRASTSPAIGLPTTRLPGGFEGLAGEVVRIVLDPDGSLLDWGRTGEEGSTDRSGLPAPPELVLDVPLPPGFDRPTVRRARVVCPAGSDGAAEGCILRLEPAEMEEVRGDGETSEDEDPAAGGEWGSELTRTPRTSPPG